MTEIPDLPRLAEYDAILFDLDGVITPTADIHMHAWRVMFTDVFSGAPRMNVYFLPPAKDFARLGTSAESCSVWQFRHAALAR